MKKSTLENLEVYCPNETCGDPLPSNDGVIRYQHRLLTFTGFKDLWKGRDVYGNTKAYFMCPVCGNTRAFGYDKERIVEKRP